MKFCRYILTHMRNIFHEFHGLKLCVPKSAWLSMNLALEALIPMLEIKDKSKFGLPHSEALVAADFCTAKSHALVECESQ